MMSCYWLEVSWEFILRSASKQYQPLLFSKEIITWLSSTKKQFSFISFIWLSSSDVTTDLLSSSNATRDSSCNHDSPLAALSVRPNESKLSMALTAPSVDFRLPPPCKAKLKQVWFCSCFERRFCGTLIKAVNCKILNRFWTDFFA